ncbi:uncharacterized protein LOC126552239 [Aphis gossypii]|uniref:uncharacterized protein LOC126552239 n=1 Tax=Aphis gossypii TaxID=80765 RepID=UPI0021597781|nr:uncharacterized protein LOC126552239 [Aphis gossypii]XP_050062895.1 uncharacterized protein LOC126552239 [Aphis gossypii]
MECDVILVDHDYVTNTAENQNVNECPNVTNISDFNVFSNNEEIVYNTIQLWELTLPPNWHKYLSNDQTTIGISEIIFIKNRDNINSFLRKTIIIEKDLKITCNILGKNINADNFQNALDKVISQQHLENVIKEAATFKICRGLDFLHDKKSSSYLATNNDIIVDTMLHKRNLNCSIIIPHGYYCFPCARTRKMLKQRSARLVAQCSPKRVTLKMTPKSKKKLSLLQKRNELLRKQKKNCINKIKLLRQNMSELMSKFENVSKESISQKLTEMNCSGYQKTIIEEIVSAAKISNPKGRRYSDEWIMLCMLLHIRTPSGYNFCKKNDILPLPSVSSLRRYLAMIDTACGFDKNFFTLFKKHLERQNYNAKTWNYFGG